MLTRSKGALLFAHNTSTIDYLKIAKFSASLIKQYLKIPVSLITDSATLLSSSDGIDVFDSLMVVEAPSQPNFRHINGIQHQFLNSNRARAWALTPYDRTLLMDSDLLIYSNRLTPYLDCDDDFLICEKMTDLTGNYLSQNDIRVSDKTIDLRWATTVIFNKNELTKKIFETVDYIHREYRYFADTYQFDTNMFRNDYAFSISNHMFNGFTADSNYLPPIMMTNQQDKILDISEKYITINSTIKQKQAMVTLEGVDVHIMDKIDLINNL
jgi:hypothetical protein